MFTPGVTRHRDNVRQQINDAFPNVKPEDIFERVKKPGSQFIELYDLEPYCEKANCPAAAVQNVFAPYGTKNMLITQAQWVNFMKQGFPLHQDSPVTAPLDERQRFLLTKFVQSLQIKFGRSMGDKWNAALLRNPPDAVNTSLKLSALCQLFENMNLPFTVSEFIDALFIFYGEKIDSISKVQFGDLFSAKQ